MSLVARRLLLAVCASAVSLSPFLLAQDPPPISRPELGTPSAISHDGIPDILMGTASLAGRAKLFSGAPGHPQLAFGAPFGEAFPGGVRVAAGDVNGDGIADAIVAMGPGVVMGAGGTPTGGLVKIYNGLDASLIGEGFPFGPGASGGIFVATGDIDADGRDELIASEGAGARVRVYSLAGAGALVAELTPYGGAFTGGIRVAAGDVTGDGRADVITAPASGAGAVKVFSGGTTPIGELFPFGPGFGGGVFVAAGDVNGDGRADIVASTSSGLAHVKVFDAASGGLLHNIGPFQASGVSVAAADVNLDGKADIIGGLGPGGAPIVGIIDGATGTLLASFLVDNTSFRGGVVVASRSNPGIRFTSDDETTFTTGAAGTFTVTTSAAPAVTSITQTGTLPTGVTFTDNHDGTATLSGTVPVGSGGVFTLTFTAQNGVSSPAQQTFTLTVTGPPQITSANQASFHVGAPDAFIVTTIGFPAPALTSTGALPAGIAFTDNGDGTATLAGTPAAGTAGTYSLTLTATNGAGSPATQAFTLIVDSAPAFTSASAAAFIVGTLGSFAITTTADPPVATIALTGVLPPDVTFTDNGDGTASLSGTPAAGTEGTYPLIFTASNGVHANAVQNFTLSVNLAATITSAATATFQVGAAGSFTVTTTGLPTPALSITAGTLPAGVTFVDNGNGTATLAGTAAAATGGLYTLTVQASNGVGAPATQSFALQIHEAPAITSAAQATFAVGTPGSFVVTASGFPAPTITSSGGLPADVTFVDNTNGTATLSGVPAAATGGTFTLSLQATNAVTTTPQSFTLTVNEAPVFSSAISTTFVVGTAGTFDVVTTGFPTAALSTASALPDGVTFVDDGDGTASLSGVPAAGEAGVYPLAIVADNGVGAPITQNFTLTVNQVPAITSAAAVSFVVGVAGAFDVVATGFPTPAIAHTGTLPAGVGFIDNGDGSGALSGTPDPGTGGTYNLTFEASNSAGTSPVQNFVLSVNAPPQFTSADTTTFTAGAVSAFSVTTTGTPTPTVSATGTLPAGVTFNTGTKTFEGTPTQTGTFDSIVLTATNGANPDATQNFTLNVICPIITVSSTPATVANGVFGVVYAGATFNQTGGGAGTWSATGLPPGLAVDADTGVLSGTPTNTGVFNGTVTFTGAADCQGSQNVSVAVAPDAQPDSYTGGVGNTQFVVASHSSPSTPFFSFSSSVLANDSGPALSVTPVTNAATTLGGQITISANGAFTYTPQAGDTGNDTYAYTVTSNGVSAQATITFGLGTQRVWYVNDSGGAGAGTSNAPFNTLTAAGGADGASDYVYIYPGTYSGGFTTEPGETVWGAGAIFNPVSGLSIPAGAKPTLTGTLTIASDNVTISSLAISTGTQTAVQNTGTRTGLTIKNDVTVATTTGTAVMFNGVSSTNGASPNFGINFQSVSANGAGNGIVLTNVNTASGSFTITGTGSANSGGTIQSTIGAGILLTNVRNVSFSSLRLLSTGGSGVQGTQVTNFSFVDGEINGSGSPALTDSSNLAFNGTAVGTENNLQGTVTITGNQLLNAAYHGVDILNYAGTIADANISTNTITSSTSAATSLGSGIRLIAWGSASTVASVTRATIAANVITNFPAGAGILAFGGNANPAGSAGTMGLAGSATDIVAITGNRIAGQSAANRMGTHAIQAGVNGWGQGNFNISNNGTVANPITNIFGNVISHSSLGVANVTSTISNNVIVANHGANEIGSLGISVGAGEASGIGGTATLTTTISGNQVSQTDANGILVAVREATSSVTARILNNTVAAPLGGVRPGIRVDAGNTAPGSVDTSMCIEISGNTSAGSGGSPGLGLRKQGTDPAIHSFGIEGLSPSPTGTPNVENLVNAANPAGSGTLLISATTGFTSCTVP